MELKPGYKQTEVGVIPEDWEVKTLGEVGRFRKGRGVTKDQTRSGNIPCIRYGELYTHHHDVIKHIHSWISPEVASTAVRLFDGDILFAGSGETKQDIGKSAAFIGGFSAYAGGDIVILSPLSCNATYLGYYLNTVEIATQKASRGQGDAVVHISSSALSSIICKLPPLPEQKAIAQALSDMDALISGLDDLIAKKRDIKQATMQQLLTGTTRLPGFAGEWEVKRLGDVADIKTGNRNNDDKEEDGRYPFFVRSDVVERINNYSHECEAILVPGEGRIGSIFHYINGRFNVHQRVYAITNFRPDICGKFLHCYLIKNFGVWAMQNTVKATVDSLRLPTFQTFAMRIPPSLAEQKAIAMVLTDMDDELTALEQRREKTRELKQAMMQELLTGRTRLV
jgi:type I restriction enzyme S subunit